LRVAQSYEIRIGDEVEARLPGLACFSYRFTGARVGTANRKIESLRDRVLASARERVQNAMDVRRLPSLAAFSRAFPELVRSARKPWLDELYRTVSRRDPFPVVNDALDLGRLLALHYCLPISFLDVSTLAPPLIVRIAPPGAVLKTPTDKMVDLADLPVLWDSAGPVGPPLFESLRAMPTRRTTDLLLVAFDPPVEPRLDEAELRSRSANWLASLLGSRPVEG